MTTDEVLGAAIKKRRQQQRMRQVDVAELIRVHPQTYHGYEAGKVSLSEERLRQIAAVLDTSPAALRYGHAEAPGTNGHAPTGEKPEGAREGLTDYQRGVLDAAFTMSATVTALINRVRTGGSTSRRAVSSEELLEALDAVEEAQGRAGSDQSTQPPPTEREDPPPPPPPA